MVTSSPHRNSKRVSQASASSGTSAKSLSRQIGPWRLGRTLGRGSSGRVRLAKNATNGQLAAVKIVPKTGEKKGLPYGIEREVVIMKLIEHPNVMRLYDVWENRGELYLILEYIEGGELFDYLVRRGRLDEQEAVHYFRQVIAGIDYCHRFNICHRDLKPENLLMDKHKNIKIADFGMAALEPLGRMLETSCGSPHYASPEIVAGKTYHGAPSDIWSCGIILFALLTGHLPFDDENIRNLLLKVKAGQFVMPTDLSPEAKNLIWGMLDVDPKNRIDMKRILRHPLLNKYPSKAPITPVPPKPEQIDRPVRSRSEIDSEILKNLQTLWHGEKKEVIIDLLLSPEPNAEKTFYCLLIKYRHDHLENYEGSDSPTLSIPMKKSGSRARVTYRKHSRSSSKRGVTFARTNTNTTSKSRSPHGERRRQSILNPLESKKRRDQTAVMANRSTVGDPMVQQTRKVSAEFASECDVAFGTLSNPGSPKAPSRPLPPTPNETIMSAYLDEVVANLGRIDASPKLRGSIAIGGGRIPLIYEEEQFADAPEDVSIVEEQTRNILGEVSVNLPIRPRRVESSKLRISSLLQPGEGLSLPSPTVRAVSAPATTTTFHSPKNELVAKRPAPPAPKRSIFGTVKKKTSAPPTPVLESLENQQNETRNWFSKMLNIKPGNKTISTKSSAKICRRTLGEIFVQWNEMGVGIKADRIGDILRGKVDSRNAMKIKPVKFRVEVCDRVGGSQVIFIMEKGAASSFVRVVREVERELVDRGIITNV
ncbi:Serine/threonine-protein kinase HSL1 [Neolecta irregularis DAH-3]|uniref:non-specific serine/threonine protein kinase n=1 Tax=Neolecta irregularis (strain DAH-3) TaxID=1198029 RepID=A0A1U7LNY2_NEOID|nr:Serine/threonine-protein kinase HSL1 [Neolecta irregularis DAH-3]|eukprot:OLL24338.1 Serine/threonine-protein kinase HSL1 [Neolecta irregularis DAH-3]